MGATRGTGTSRRGPPDALIGASAKVLGSASLGCGLGGSGWLEACRDGDLPEPSEQQSLDEQVERRRAKEAFVERAMVSEYSKERRQMSSR
jgi:hypothetical protein